ncbi:hypothetical protein BJV74DRAFT_576100 [Russula compacta]|nr:hypothetical protein BJV74DRAFT_576100 [Russula compacta]
MYFGTLSIVLRRVIASAAETRVLLTPCMIQTTCLMMNFLTLYCNASPRLCCGASISALLSTVAIYASRLDNSCFSCHLLTAISSFEDSRCHIPPSKFVNMGFEKIPWEIALSCPSLRSDILTASCLASCVLAPEHLESLPTSTAVEIWDYLRDVLLLIITGHYIGDEAPLGFLVAPTLCEALLVLLRQTGDRLGNQFLTICQRY